MVGLFIYDPGRGQVDTLPLALPIYAKTPTGISVLLVHNWLKCNVIRGYADVHRQARKFIRSLP